jgi:hypothetical protein
MSSMMIVFFTASCDKKEGCTDKTALNYDADAEVDCCCEYAPVIYADSTAYKLHMHQYVGDLVFTPGNTYSIGGVLTQLDIARFYVSNIRLVDADGNEMPFYKVYLLADAGFEEYDLGSNVTGNFTKIRFDIGVDAGANHTDPGDYPSSHPLSYQSPAMNWGWSFGYIFMLIHGEVDTDADGSTDASLINHLGTDELLRTVEVEYPLTSTKEAEATIHLNVDWALLYQGINLALDYKTEVTDEPELAEALMNNAPGMFSIEE